MKTITPEEVDKAVETIMKSLDRSVQVKIENITYEALRADSGIEYTPAPCLPKSSLEKIQSRMLACWKEFLQNRWETIKASYPTYFYTTFTDEELLEYAELVDRPVFKKIMSELPKFELDAYVVWDSELKKLTENYGKKMLE